MCDMESETQLFYKYTSFSSALSILATNKMAYRHPRFFNDPFDSHIQEILDFNTDNFQSAFRQGAEKIIGDRSTVIHANSDMPPYYVECVHECRELYSTQPSLALSNFDEKTRGWREELCAEALRRFSKPELQILLNRMRVLCLSDLPCTIPMWSHYSESHRGAVIGIRIPLNKIEQVQYTRELPEQIDPATFLARKFLGLEEYNPDRLFKLHLATKSQLWNYENEWRVITYTELYGPDPYFGPAYSVEHLYLGCKMEPDAKLALSKFARSQFPNILITDCNRYKGQYELEMSEYKLP